MQQPAGLPVGQQAQAQEAHPAPATARIANICENPDLYPLQLGGYLEETGSYGGCIFGRLYSPPVGHGQTEMGVQHPQQPILSRYLDSVLETLPGEHQLSPPRLGENIEASETAGGSEFVRTFELLATGIPQQPNTPRSTGSAEEHEETPRMLQRYIDQESGKDGGSVYARLFETLDTLKVMENLHNK